MSWWINSVVFEFITLPVTVTWSLLDVFFIHLKWVPEAASSFCFLPLLWSSKFVLSWALIGFEHNCINTPLAHLSCGRGAVCHIRPFRLEAGRYHPHERNLIKRQCWQWGGRRGRICWGVDSVTPVTHPPLPFPHEAEEEESEMPIHSFTTLFFRRTRQEMTS